MPGKIPLNQVKVKAVMSHLEVNKGNGLLMTNPSSTVKEGNPELLEILSVWLGNDHKVSLETYVRERYNFSIVFKFFLCVPYCKKAVRNAEDGI